VAVFGVTGFPLAFSEATVTVLSCSSTAEVKHVRRVKVRDGFFVQPKFSVKFFCFHIFLLFLFFVLSSAAIIQPVPVTGYRSNDPVLFYTILPGEKEG
jgi:hypothetical protein